MQFDSVSAFLAMGGHGIFVFSAYAITFIVLIVNVIQPIWQRRKLVAELKSQQQRDRS